MADLLYGEECYKIIGACLEVHKDLGCGYLEAVYAESLKLELCKCNIPHVCEKGLNIYFKGVKLKKKYYADFICFDKIVLEIKAVDKLCSNHVSQVLNYLKSSKLRLGILINFGEMSLKYKRIVL